MRRDIKALIRDQSDEELMTLLQGGTEEAFNILVERFTDKLRIYLYNFVRDDREVDDLLQETWMRVYRNRHSYKKIARLSTWIYTIAGNLARTQYRSKKRRKTTSMNKEYEGEELESIIPDRKNVDADRWTDDRMRDAAVHKAIAELSDSFREVLVMRDIQELSYDEIADITGLPMGTVKSQINRGRTFVKKYIRERGLADHVTD